jgi:hypothetical protein
MFGTPNVPASEVTVIFIFHLEDCALVQALEEKQNAFYLIIQHGKVFQILQNPAFHEVRKEPKNAWILISC